MSADSHTVALARNAMATRFEMVLHGHDPAALRAAGEEALDEIERIEALLSLYRPTSEVAAINAAAWREPLRVSPEVFRLVEQAQELSRATDGAFDCTIGALMRCWDLMGGKGKVPDPSELAAAKATVGMDLVRLDSDKLTVRFEREGVILDLGAIGKGYAIDRAVELLKENAVTSGLIHGGTSTVCSFGRKSLIEIASDSHQDPQRDEMKISLDNESLSVSKPSGKSFESEGKTYGHVMDPHTGQPVSAAVFAAVILPSATETDALSTALLTGGIDVFEKLVAYRPGIRAIVVFRDEEGMHCRACGIEVRESWVGGPWRQKNRAD